MSKYLTPEEVTHWAVLMEEGGGNGRHIATLREADAIVRALAEKAAPGVWGVYRCCPVCGTNWLPDQPERHKDECIGLRARRYLEGEG